MALTKITGDNIQPGSITTVSLAEGAGGGPKISNIQIANSSYSLIDDTAIALEGGYIVITGTGFAAGCQVVINSNNATSITFVNSTTIRAQVGAADAGTKTVYVVNSDGGTAIRINGLTYSATPTWVTESTLAEQLTGSQISIQLSASGDEPLTYQLQAGSSLPNGLSLSSSGLISGSVSVENNTTYNFTVEVYDAQNQNASPRSFSVTITVGELYFKTVTLLINAEGSANTGNNSVFTDSSTNPITITRQGNPLQGSFTPFSPQGWSAYFGADTYVNVPAATSLSSELNFFGMSWCMEGWVYVQTFSNYGFIVATGQGTGSYTPWAYVGHTNTGNWRVSPGDASDNNLPYALTKNSWQHFALTNNGSRSRLFVNGQLIFTKLVTYSRNDAQNIVLGGYTTSGGYPLIGYLSNVRVSREIPELYQTSTTTLNTQVFTPPVQKLTALTNTEVLVCQDSYFKDNSTNDFNVVNTEASTTAFSPFLPTESYSVSIQMGSIYFDGTGDYLTTASSDKFGFGTGNFTVEFWVYMTSRPGTWRTLFDIGQYSSGILMRDQNTAAADSLYLAGTSLNWNPQIHLKIKSWNHVALTRSGTSVKVFVNGKTVLNTTNSNNLGSSQNLFIGESQHASGQTWSGYISNFRIVKGAAVYTSNFNVPSSPISAISGTTFLCNFNGANIYDYSAKHNIELIGTAQARTETKKYGSASVLLTPGGGSNYLKIPLSNELKFYAGEDFTIECWIYLITNVAGICAVFSNYNSFSAGSLSLFAGHNGANNNLFHIAHNGGFPALSSSTTVNSRLNTWTHLAVVRSNGQIKLYVDGTSEGTPFASTVDLTGVGNFFWVGTSGDSLAANPNCYIDEFRVSKGFARYTSNFTPPTSAHSLR